jgi:hypothetical protein
MGISWVDYWLLSNPDRISLMLSDFSPIILVWNSMTYLATTSSTSLEGGIDSLIFALSWD